MSEAVTRRLSITGRVQGVGYRDWCLRTARAAGLNGWVRNRADGSVEALVHGPPAIVEVFVAACQAGPPLARVTAVDTVPAPETPEPGFRQLPTL
ncbi:MAG: acylphosphatase [Rhodospirillaceae bacterium]|nr:acylphosphatase [Rhodospirillaceae bacterium]